MIPMLAASLFDSPWLVAILVIGGMIANWLTQRRKAQQEAAESTPEADESSAANKPAEAFNLDEMLRRVLGGEAAPTSPAPAPRARSVPTTPPPILESPWMDDSAETSLPIVAARKNVNSFAIPQTPEQAAERFEHLNEQGRHPAKALDLRRSRPGRGTRAALWRDRQKVREAFVASLVFAPPKGLEES